MGPYLLNPDFLRQDSDYQNLDQLINWLVDIIKIK